MTGRLTSDEIEKFLRLYKKTINDLKELFGRSDDFSRVIEE